MFWTGFGKMGWLVDVEAVLDEEANEVLGNEADRNVWYFRIP